MEQLKAKFDFPNPIEHIEIGDKPIKLEELCRNIENGEITVILSENISDFKVKDNTLLKIVSGKIVNAYSGNQNIMNEIVSWNN